MSDALGQDEVRRDAASPLPDPTLGRLVERFPDCGWDVSHTQVVAVVPPERLVEAAEWLLDDEGFQMCVDLTVVDYLDHWDRPLGTWTGEPTRFEVVVNLLSLERAARLRLRVPVAEPDDGSLPVCPTLAYVWPSADACEREAYDLLGIVFEGHPDLTRIMMPDDWEGHPLRKDYPAARIPVAFRDAPEPGGEAP